MKTRETILGVYVLLACVSCVRDKPTENEAGAAPPPAAPASAKPLASAAATAPRLPASAVAYDDKNDVPGSLAESRCKDPMPANAKPAGVKLVMGASPPTIEIEVASLGVKQTLWPGPGTATECHASLDGAAYRFRCSDGQDAVDGKIYARKSDIVIGRALPGGTGSTKFILPCGTPAKLEPIACPKECKKTGEKCVCSAK